MKNRAQALGLLTELRGRLDELEQLIRMAPDVVVPEPAMDGEPGVEVLTPPGYLAFREAPPAAPERRKAYAPFGGFVQFGAPGPEARAAFESFALSDLHRAENEDATGLRLVPQSRPQGGPDGDAAAWFTYEFLAGPVLLAEWDWLEWGLKLSCDAALRLNPRFVLSRDGKTRRIALPECWLGPFATFLQFRLDRSLLQDLPEKPVQLRLVLGGGGTGGGSTGGGQALPLTLYQLALHGKRRSVKG